MSTRGRFFTEAVNYPAESEVCLTGEEFTHAATVLRIAAGAEIILLDNSGKEYSAIVVNVGKKQLTAHITGVNAGDREAKSKIYLLCGALKGDKTELVVQKATELGVCKIAVCRSRYCSAYVTDNKFERLNKVVREAAKQCLRSVAPEVVYLEDFTDALASAAEYDNKLFFCEFAGRSEVALYPMRGSCALVVGSEGGFCDGEYAVAREKYGFYGVSLGKRILRAETAAIAACALTAFSLGELE